MPFKGCIYELDGVVADIAPFRYASWKWAAEELGYSLSSKQYLKLVGLDSKNTLERIIKWSLSRISEADKQRILLERKHRYLDSLNNLSEEHIIDGFRSFNAGLRENGIKVALISSNKYTVRIVDKLDLVLDLDAIVDSDMLIESASEEELCKLACEKLQLQPAECLVVLSENSESDKLQTLGFKTIGRREGKQQIGTLKFVNSWAEITQSQLSELFVE